MKKTLKTEQTITHDYTIEHFPLADFIDVSHFDNGADWHVMTLETVKNVQGFQENFTTTRHEKLVDSKTLKKILSKPYNYDSIISQARQTMHVVSLKYAEQVKKGARNHTMREALGLTLDSPIEDRIIDSLKSGQAEVVQFATPENNEVYQHIWRQSNGQYFCEPYIMDYIEARLDNEKYYLDPLTQHLSERNDITFIVGEHPTRYLKAPLRGNEPYINEIITEVPYYNREEGRDEYIHIIYEPSHEDIEKILAWKKDKEYYNVRYYIINEILDAKQFLVKPPEPAIETEAPKRKFRK